MNKSLKKVMKKIIHQTKSVQKKRLSKNLSESKYQYE